VFLQGGGPTRSQVEYHRRWPVKLDAMTIGQILEISDTELDELDESEQQLVVAVIVAVIESELRHGSPRMEDPRKALPSHAERHNRSRFHAENALSDA